MSVINKFINSKDITFVVQGKNIEGVTSVCLKSIRRFFPKSCIVFSTYCNENLSDLTYDVLVCSNDPGAEPINKRRVNNINRILLTTIEGLKVVNTKYCVRMRSDMCFDNNKLLLNLPSLFKKRNKDFIVFKERVVFFQLWSRLTEEIQGKHYLTPFSYSDWFCFGLTSDIQNYFFNTPFTLEPEFSTHFANPENRIKGWLFDSDKRQFRPEQYFGTSFFKQYYQEADLKNYQDFDEERMAFSEEVMANNVITAGYRELGVYIKKSDYEEISKTALYPKDSDWLKGVATFNEFIKLYRKYCDKNFIEPYYYYKNNSESLIKSRNRKRKYSEAFKKQKKLKTFFNIGFAALQHFVKNIILRMNFILRKPLPCISSSDISVVIQGRVDRKYIYKTLKSIRKFLPKAEIILSTWEGTDVEGLDYDILQLNPDPGAEVFTPSGIRQNQNRQILSTQNGIKLATRKYVLKLRSDMQIKGTKFLTYFGKYKKRNDECKILKERILINSLYTRKSLYPKVVRGEHILQPYLFHVSDWMMFGLREDMINIWDIPLAPEPVTSQYFKNNPDLPHDRGCLTRWHAEQYIWLEFLKKNGINHNYDNYWVYDKNYERLSELSIVNNTILLEYKKEFDILCQKYTYQFGDSETMHPYDWFVLYQKFCDKDFVIPFKYTWIQDFHLAKYLAKLNKQWSRVKNFCKTLFNIFAGLAGVIYYLIHIIFNLIIFTPKFIVKVIRRIFSR